MGGRSQKRRDSSHGVNFGKERGVSSLKGGREEGPVLARYDLAWRRKRARLM